MSLACHLSCVLLVGVVHLVAGADDLAGPGGEPLYHGEPLTVWEARAADIDPKSAYAATLVAPLVEIIQDERVPDTVRGRLAVTLGRIGKPARPAAPVLAAILGSSSEPMSNRVWAGRSLGLLGEHASPAAEVLIAFLFDEQVPFGLRAVPIEALAMIGSRHPDVLPALVKLFQYSPPADSDLSPGEVTALRELAAEAFAVLKADANVAVPLLSRAIRDPTEAECIRRKSLVALGRIGASAAVAIPAIMESLEFDPSDAARDEAARALAGIEGDAHVMMQHYLAHPEAAVRWRVAAAMGTIKSPRPDMLADLRGTTADPSEVVRMASVESLGKLRADRAVFIPVAIQLLTSNDRQIRMRAMRVVLSRQPLDTSETALLAELARHEDRRIARLAELIRRKLRAEATE